MSETPPSTRLEVDGDRVTRARSAFRALMRAEFVTAAPALDAERVDDSSRSKRRKDLVSVEARRGAVA
jgi:hypothetical protein